MTGVGSRRRPHRRPRRIGYQSASPALDMNIEHFRMGMRRPSRVLRTSVTAWRAPELVDVRVDLGTPTSHESRVVAWLMARRSVIAGARKGCGLRAHCLVDAPATAHGRAVGRAVWGKAGPRPVAPCDPSTVSAIADKGHAEAVNQPLRQCAWNAKPERSGHIASSNAYRWVLLAAVSYGGL